ncbi:MAG: hypothetical protein RRZ33_09410 [Lachnospiraceae bacterium]
MKKCWKIRVTASLLVFVLLFTEINIGAMAEVGTETGGEIVQPIENTETVVPTDNTNELGDTTDAPVNEINYLMEKDVFYQMVSDALIQEPIHTLTEIFGYESMELEAQLMTENTQLFLLGSPIIEKDYKVYTFLKTEESGMMSVIFFTEKLGTQKEKSQMNAKLSVSVDGLTPIYENGLITYTISEGASEESGTPADPTAPGAPADPAAPGTPADPTAPGAPTDPTAPGAPTDPTTPGTPGTPADPTTPDTPAEPTVPETPGDPIIPEIPVDSTKTQLMARKVLSISWMNYTMNCCSKNRIAQLISTKEVVPGTEPIPGTEPTPTPGTEPELTPGTEPEGTMEGEATGSSNGTITKMAIMSQFSFTATDISPTLNKAANLVSNQEEHATYDITLTVTGASKEVEEIHTQPADVVFAIDVSNSMKCFMDSDGFTDESTESYSRWNYLKSALDRMIDRLMIEGTQNRVKIIMYAGSAGDKGKDYVVLDTDEKSAEGIKAEYNTDISTLNRMINPHTDPYRVGATDSKAGFIGVLKELRNLKDSAKGRKQYVIYMSDGVPTCSKLYYGESNGMNTDSDGYEYSESYIYGVAGRGTAFSEDARNQAICVAREINREFPEVLMYTVGISAVTEFSDYLLNIADYENGGYDKQYKSAANASDLENTFNELTQTIASKVSLTQLKATDKLSKYVELDQSKPITVNNLTLYPENSDAEILSYKKDGKELVKYSKKEKKFTWTVADVLGEGEKRSFTYTVNTTADAISYDDTFQGKPGCQQGAVNSGTHASDNGEDIRTQYGYPSNQSAAIIYRDRETQGRMSFPHPVVQSVAKGTLIITKNLKKDYVKLSPDAFYNFCVTLSSQKSLEYITCSELDMETNIQYSDDEYHQAELYISLKAKQSLVIQNLPLDTTYTIWEDKDEFDNPYYEIDDSIANGNYGSDCKMDEDTEIISGSLTKIGINEKKEYELAVYESLDQKKTWFNSETGEEITDGAFIKELKKELKIKSTGEYELGKKVANRWTLGIQPEDEAKTSENGFWNEEQQWIWAKGVERSEYSKTIGVNKEVYKNGLGVEVPISINSNGKPCTSSGMIIKKLSGNHEFEYLNKQGEWRICQETTNYGTGNYWYEPYYSEGSDGDIFLDENDRKSIRKIESEYYIYNDSADKKCKIIRRTSSHTASFYEYNGQRYSTGEELFEVLKASITGNRSYYSYMQDNKIIFITYDRNYSSQEDYLIAEKEYCKIKKTEYTSSVENFSSTGAKTEVNIVNAMKLILGELNVNKELKVKDGIDSNTFIFSLENIDKESPGYGMVMYRELTLDKDTQQGTFKFENLPMGSYQITEADHMRYQQVSITEEGLVQLKKGDEISEVTVINEKVSNAGFSASAVAVNNGTVDSLTGETIIKYLKKLMSVMINTFR